MKAEIMNLKAILVELKTNDVGIKEEFVSLKIDIAEIHCCWLNAAVFLSFV